MFVSKRQISLLTIIIAVLTFGLLLTFLNIYELHRLAKTADLGGLSSILGKQNCNQPGVSDSYGKPIAWVKSKKKSKTYLKHVINSFKAHNHHVEYFDEEESISEEKWNVLWSHNYPFNSMKTYLRGLKKQHCINHFPGTGFITQKVHLATSKFSFVPKAFRMPEEKNELVAFAAKNPAMMFVQKSNDHRGIKIETIKQLDLSSKETFVQQFVHNPLLIDGHKFDIGVYTIVTSANPLRVYRFEDVLFRFCPEKYHPFSADHPKKYVVGDDYLPTWNVPSLKHYYNVQGLGMRAAFDAWLQENEKDPAVVWDQVASAISEIFHAKEELIIKYSKPYSKNVRFFEVMRFDFIIDDQLKVYLMEANMSPNLSSAHFSQNRLLYEQVVFNTLSLVGLPYKACQSEVTSDKENEMRVAQKDLIVFPQHCKSNCYDETTCSEVQCQLCKPCLTSSVKDSLKLAFLEHNWKASCLRIVPGTIKDPNTPTNNQNLSASNTLMTEWFRGKCLMDSNFC